MILIADDIRIGDYLPEERKFVAEISYTASRVILRCCYEPGNYPSTSLICSPTTEFEVIRNDTESSENSP
jgi:hypothetical protein